MEPSVICLQETKTKPNQQINIRDFNLYRYDETSEYAKGGSLITAKNSIYSEKIELKPNIRQWQ